MDLESISASSRRSARKRQGPPSNTGPESVHDEAQAEEPRASVARKRRAIEHPNAGTPVRESRASRSASPARGSSTGAQGKIRPLKRAEEANKS